MHHCSHVSSHSPSNRHDRFLVRPLSESRPPCGRLGDRSDCTKGWNTRSDRRAVACRVVAADLTMVDLTMVAGQLQQGNTEEQ